MENNNKLKESVMRSIGQSIIAMPNAIGKFFNAFASGQSRAWYKLFGWVISIVSWPLWIIVAVIVFLCRRFLMNTEKYALQEARKSNM